MYALGVTRDDAAMAEHSVPADGAANGDVPESERARLAAAWAAAHYFVTLGRKEWLFCTGLTAPEIERQVMADRYLFITAWNPPPGETPRADNDAAQARLEARVQALGLSLHPALGCDNRGGMVEYGCLVLDATLAQADALAREFGQGGTLCWSTGEPVRLRMMRPRPAEAGDDPSVRKRLLLMGRRLYRFGHNMFGMAFAFGLALWQGWRIELLLCMRASLLKRPSLRNCMLIRAIPTPSACSVRCPAWTRPALIA